MREISYGKRYEETRELGSAAIAKLIRKDVKAAQLAGELPRCKVSVRTRRSTTSSAIDVVVSDLPFNPHNPERIKLEMEARVGEYRTQLRHTEQANELLKKVSEIVAAYNFDGSEIETDYFHVRFYGSVHFDWQWEGAQKEALEKELAPAAPAEELEETPPMPFERPEDPLSRAF